MKDIIYAAITTFNPSISRLFENISAIINQVDKLLIFDNGSVNFHEIQQLIQPFNKIKLLRSENNLGIAAALNRLFLYASNEKCDWLFTLDQDSVAAKDIISRYKKYINLPNVGILSCEIKDRNFSTIDKPLKNDFQKIDLCITSGAFCSVRVWEKSEKFDEWMFIDYVDFDYCLSIRKLGYYVYKINYIGLLHEVGHSRNVRFLGRNYVDYNESVFRQYYLGRNKFYISRKYRTYFNPIKEFCSEIRTRIFIKKYENDSKEKLAARKRGRKDGKQKVKEMSL